MTSAHVRRDFTCAFCEARTSSRWWRRIIDGVLVVACEVCRREGAFDGKRGKAMMGRRARNRRRAA